MIRICRGDDGHLFQTNATLRDIERAGNLETFIRIETGIEPNTVEAYLADGRRLTTSNVRELAGAQDQTIYVFNKRYLEYELDDVLQALHVIPTLQPPVEEAIPANATPPFRPAHLSASYLRAARHHHDNITHTHHSMRLQSEFARVILSHLDFFFLPVYTNFENLATTAAKTFADQGMLLDGLEVMLVLVGKVKVHVEFMSAGMKRAITENGERHRTLGDYVSSVKMRNVGEGCARMHEEMIAKFQFEEQAVIKLKEKVDYVRVSVLNKRLVEEAEACVRRSQGILEKITEYAAMLEGSTPGKTQSPPSLASDTVLYELRQLDANLRNELTFITQLKNDYTSQCLVAIRLASGITTSDISTFPARLQSLRTGLRTMEQGSFAHIRRLHRMLYAYGATVIEVVRRREFSRIFYAKAQAVLELMAKLSTSERKRRQVYRSEVYGQLPFETRGLDDDPVPMVDFTLSGGRSEGAGMYALDRGDIDVLMRVLDELEQHARTIKDDNGVRVVMECKASLQKMIVKMEEIESTFERMAERSLLSSSRLAASRRRTLEVEEQTFQELTEELRKTQESRTHQEAIFNEERLALQAEVQRLRQEKEKALTTVSAEQEKSARLERELYQVKAQLESEARVRKVMEERNADLTVDVETQRVALQRALADATEQSREVERVRQELGQVRTEFEEVKELEAKNAAKVVALLEEQANNLRKLEEARSRGEDLEAQIKAARAESEEVHLALKDASLEKDRLLRAQANEHDRIIRDHIAEADGDRAVLEHQFSEMKVMLENKERQVKDLKAEAEVANADAVGLREELRRVEHELRDARHVERLLREDLRDGQASQSAFEQRLENSSRLVAQILDVAISFRDAHLKAMMVAQSITSHASKHASANVNAMVNMAESALSSGMRHSVIGHRHDEEPEPIDPSDPLAALDILRGFDHDHFLEVIGKTSSTIRKWQKQCKEYRERAKGKISFRNFAKGDLALFLPTRNSVSKPWAAFNVSFPHYFLQATGHLSEQLKTREWIVARITSITERVVDHADPTSNPYGLGDGVKYYMLEVEDWTQPSQNKRRGSSRKTSIEKTPRDGVQAISPINSPPTGLPPAIASGPPETEVEETFRVTHPPTSQYFPVRQRANSAPGARPSSLSRLLAQAPENQPEVHRERGKDNGQHETSLGTSPSPQHSPSPAPPEPSSDSPMQTSPPPPSSPTLVPFSSIPPSVIGQSLPPLRPGSRASRLSTTSRFSGRLPTIGSSPGVKAPATTALADQTLLSSSPSNDGNPFGSPITPSPEGSVSEGMNNILNKTNRRRTTSYHVPRLSPLATSSSAQSTSTVQAEPLSARPVLTAANTLANLASNWGVSFGRRGKKPDGGPLPPTVETPPSDETRRTNPSGRAAGDSSARSILKRL